MAKKDKIQDMYCEEDWDDSYKDRSYDKNNSRRDKRKKKEKERNDNFVVDVD